MPELTLKDLRAVNRKTLAAAGPRYTPGVKPGAPNIRVKYLETFNALALAPEFRNDVADLKTRLDEALEHRGHVMKPLFSGLRTTPNSIADGLLKLSKERTTSRIGSRVRKVRSDCARVVAKLERASDLRYEELRGIPETERERRSRIDGDLDAIRRVSSAVESASEYLRGNAGVSLADRQAVLLLGAWGTGKTHLLCDYATTRTAARKPAMVVMASALSSEREVLDAVAEGTGLAKTGDGLLRALNAMGKRAGGRALLMIDAINEGDRKYWRRKMRLLPSKLRPYPNVAIVISCRRPFNDTIVNERSRQQYVLLEHMGFQESEFDAQIEFFRYYGLPAPTVPLLTPEFSRPLFLKILCEALHRLSKRSQKQKLREVASGQKGMTYVLEQFAKEVGRPIEDTMGLPRVSCWRALKGSADPSRLGIAGTMASIGREWLTPSEARVALSASLGITTNNSAELLKRLLHDGLLAEDVRWSEEGPMEAIQFPYQRFGDHLIARHILDGALNTSSEQAVKRSFFVNRPIGALFELDQWGNQFKAPGLAAAIAIEFPERMRRTGLPREVLHYLPKSRRLVAPIKEIYLHGLYWRAAESFTSETDSIIGFFLQLKDNWVRHEIIEVLVGLASRPGHPYSADRLRHYLINLDMAKRDVSWSEFVRLAEPTDNLSRVLAWAERADEQRSDKEASQNEIRLLSLLLTTTARPLRDRATRALVLRGCHDPESLFEETLASLDWNDPYVPERMLAACHGVAMRMWAAPAGTALRRHIGAFAKSLVREMFAPDAPHGTKHVLMRDYALGVINLARKLDRFAIATRDVPLLTGSFEQTPSPFRDARWIRASSVEDAGSAMHMDFENYTIGRLFPSRENYDDSHPGYKEVKKQIARRMMDLGYSKDRFGEIDGQIARGQWSGRESDGGKTDRYGKKYSWIAYFEMYGLRLDQGLLLSEYRSVERTSDCDLDPSFPSEPLAREPALPSLFVRAPKNRVKWLVSGPVPNYNSLLHRPSIDGVAGGPWILLDGYVRQEGSHKRKVFTFLRGIMLRPRDVARLRREISEVTYLGNHKIPEPGSDYYTYWGEIPWSSNFAAPTRLKNGRARRHIEPALYYWREGQWFGPVQVEVPVHEWSWESHHSRLNQVSGIQVPAPSLCESLELAGHSGLPDLFDRGGAQATVFTRFPAGEWHSSRLLYMREDLVERYLAKTQQVMVWVPWGERTLHHSEFQSSRADEIRPHLQEDLHNFGSLVEMEELVS